MIIEIVSPKVKFGDDKWIEAKGGYKTSRLVVFPLPLWISPICLFQILMKINTFFTSLFSQTTRINRNVTMMYPQISKGGSSLSLSYAWRIGTKTILVTTMSSSRMAEI